MQQTLVSRRSYALQSCSSRTVAQRCCISAHHMHAAAPATAAAYNGAHSSRLSAGRVLLQPAAAVAAGSAAAGPADSPQPGKTHGAERMRRGRQQQEMRQGHSSSNQTSSSNSPARDAAGNMDKGGRIDSRTRTSSTDSSGVPFKAQRFDNSSSSRSPADRSTAGRGRGRGRGSQQVAGRGRGRRSSDQDGGPGQLMPLPAGKALNKYQLTDAIKACNTPDELHQLKQQHGSQMDAINIASAINMLPKLRTPRHQQQLQQQQRLQQQQPISRLQLLEQLWQMLQPELLLQCRGRQLASILWASSKLQFENAHIYNSCMEQYLTGAAKDTPRHLSNVVYALCTAPAAIRQQQQADVMHQLVPAFMQQLSGANAQDVSNVLYGLAGSGQELETEQVQQLLRQFIATQRTAKPQEVANTLWGVATMGQQVQPAQLQQLLTAFVGMLQHAKPQAVSNTLWAVATMGQQVEQDQLQQLLAAFVGMLRQATPQNVANTLWAVATMGQQVQPAQLQQLLAAFVGMLRQAKPQNVANTLWAVATMGQQVQPRHLQQLLAAFVGMLQQATPQAMSNTLWAVATMGQQVEQNQLQQLLAAFVGMLRQAKPQNLSNTLWACGKLGFVPLNLLSAPQLGSMVLAAKPQELANIAWACGQLGYRNEQVMAALLQEALQRLSASSSSSSFNTQERCNLCWSIAVLDLQQHADQVLLLVQACSQQWSSMGSENMWQLQQVHTWLLDFQLAGGQGLAGTLTEQQLQQCRAAWEADLDSTASNAASPFQAAVFKALQQLPISWDLPPRMEQRSVSRDGVTDGALLIDIAAKTASGVLLAIEVDGPSHFRQPDGGLTGPTQYRNRALAVRGYTVISIPGHDWRKFQGDNLRQQQYLLQQLAAVGVA